MHTDSAAAVLRDVFAHRDFRAGQERAVTAFLEGRDVSVLLPTGGGKSLCFQVPAVVRRRRGEGPTVVVSPLIALMDDQVAALESREVPAVVLHSGLTGPQRTRMLRQASAATLIYVSPERLSRPSQRAWLRGLNVSAIAIDEAHCISEWGHDFRPDYHKLGSLKAELGVPMMAVTATATPRVASEIVAVLGLEDPVRIVGGFQRENLVFGVEHCRGDTVRTERVITLLGALGVGERGGGRAVVYAGTRKRVVAVAKALKAAGFKTGHYHAGRTDSARSRAQADFGSGKLRVLVATTAFGMGIDVPDIRLVAHVQAPHTLESYVQQAGRAGRDGEEAYCLLLYSPGDAVTRSRLVGRTPTPGQEEGWRALQDYVYGVQCRQVVIAERFGGVGQACGICDVCTDVEAVARTVSAAREGVAERAHARREKRSEEDHLLLEPGQLDRIVAFVDGMKKPLGKRVIALGLRGSLAKPVKRAKLTEVDGYGALKGVPERSLQRAIEDLLASGRLARRGKKYPTVWMPDKRVRPVRTGPAKVRPERRGLEGALRKLRSREARRRRWKPYVVFNDATLAGILARRPANLADLEAVVGMGPKRVQRYGAAILELVCMHPAEEDEWDSTHSKT